MKYCTRPKQSNEIVNNPVAPRTHFEKLIKVFRKLESIIAVATNGKWQHHAWGDPLNPRGLVWHLGLNVPWIFHLWSSFVNVTTDNRNLALSGLLLFPTVVDNALLISILALDLRGFSALYQHQLFSRARWYQSHEIQTSERCNVVSILKPAEQWVPDTQAQSEED